MDSFWKATGNFARSFDVKSRRAVSGTREINMQDRFLTPAEAATYLGGLNTRTLTRWAREGYLAAFPVGEGKRRLWRFLEDDLEKWMLARRTGQVPTEIREREDTLFAATDAPKRRLLEG
jgi:excisionase family DNA binding protein